MVRVSVVIESLMEHVLVVLRDEDTGVEDEWGHPVSSSEVAVWRGNGLLVEIAANEVPTGTGAVVVDGKAYLPPTCPVIESDRVRRDPPDGRVHEIVRVLDPVAQGHHLEVLTRIIR